MKLKPGFVAAVVTFCALMQTSGMTPELLKEKQNAIIAEYMHPKTHEALLALIRQADETRNKVKLDSDEEYFTEAGFGEMSDEDKVMIERLFGILDDRTIVFLSEGIIVHPPRRIEEKVIQSFETLYALGTGRKQV